MAVFDFRRTFNASEVGGDVISTFAKLDNRVRSIPDDLSLEEADRFLRHYGFEKKRQKGSHCIFKKDSSPMLNLQGPIIKEYQILQMINAVDSVSNK